MGSEVKVGFPLGVLLVSEFSFSSNVFGANSDGSGDPPRTRLLHAEFTKAFLICCAKADVLFDGGSMGLSHVGHV